MNHYINHKALAQASAFSITQKRKEGAYMPYMKYGDWFIPDCAIRFPTESEALEYMTNGEE